MTIISYETIALRIETALIREADQNCRQLHMTIGIKGESVTMQRLGVVLSRMVREGRIVTNGKKSLPTYRTSNQERAAQEHYSDSLIERMAIQQWRPLVSIPRVAPMREIPAWSRQPL